MICPRGYDQGVLTDHPGLALAYSGQVASARIKEALAAHGLRPGAGFLLLRLADEGTISQQALGEALGTDPSVLVALLNELERDGLAERRRDPADRRRHIVQITTRGKSLMGDVHRTLADVEARLFAGLTEAEIGTLQALLARVQGQAGDEACTEEEG